VKTLVYIWILGLLVVGLVAVVFPPEDTIINPTEYKTVVQPVAVTAETPAAPVDVSVVQRVALQADSLAADVQKSHADTEALAGRVQSIEGSMATKDDVKALRDDMQKNRTIEAQGTAVLFGCFVLVLGFSLAALHMATKHRKTQRSFREGND